MSMPASKNEKVNGSGSSEAAGRGVTWRDCLKSGSYGPVFVLLVPMISR
jgi:hypothetical protein